MLGRRVEAIRRELASRRLDALVVSELTNVRYLTGFTGSNGLCLITPRRFSLVTDSRYTAQAHAEVRHASLRIARRSLIAELANDEGSGRDERSASSPNISPSLNGAISGPSFRTESSFRPHRSSSVSAP